MGRIALVIAIVAGIAQLSSAAVCAASGNALAGPSSKVGPALTLPRQTLPRRVRTTTAAVAPTPPRIPMRNAPAYQPTVSPYANIFQPGVSRIFNYYTLVKPQLVQQQVNQQRSAQIQILQQQLEAGGASPKASNNGGRFMNYGRYFGNQR